MSSSRTRPPRLAVASILVLALVLLAAPPAAAQWVEYANETGTRLSADPGNGTNDTWEKDYAWGDVDQDGDIDLVVVRKQPFTSSGKASNVLFMNEGGVLVDRTAQYASASDVAGDMGFLTPTNDRDVVLVDVNNDTWLDIVTAVTISDGDPKYIGHPRVYINLGEDGGGNWQGFRFENDRMTAMLSYSGLAGFNPRFCSVAAGDVDGDGWVDLWFGDYDSSGDGGNEMPEGADYNDKLLLNVQNGTFKDFTQTQLQDTVSIPNFGTERFEVSAFGAAAVIADMNDDGMMDIVKQTSLNDPLYVGIAYNDPTNEGFFESYNVVNQQAPYFVSVGDLNNDDLPDMVITDDGADRYMLHQGVDQNGQANFISSTFSYENTGDDGFGSNSLIVDLDKDGWQDVLIADVDVDIDGCGRRMHVYRNLGGTPGDHVVLREETEGTGCSTTNNPSSCTVVGIPSNMLQGVHDVAVFDINGDTWPDMVIGRCGTTEVWMNQPPVGLTFNYPQGIPAFFQPGSPFTFQIQVEGFGGAQHADGTGQLFVSVEGGPFQEVALSDLGSGLYEGTLPSLNCTEAVRYYIVAEDTTGATFTDPQSAPAESLSAVAATGLATVFEDDIEGDTSAWSVVNDPALSTGAWEVAEPNGTITNGQFAAPDEDANASNDQTRAWVTENGVAGGGVGVADVDGGPTDLITPVFDVSGTDATLTFSRWFYGGPEDALTVWVTNNGADWVLAKTITGVQNEWTIDSVRVGEFVTPTSTVQVRFRTSDETPASIVEAGIDAVRLEKYLCAADSPAGGLDAGGGTPLTVDLAGSDLTLNWGGSCSVDDTDFEVYEGTIGDWSSHRSLACSTGGSTSATVTPAAGGTYYLVVPTNGGAEGSYGQASSGAERPVGSPSCLPQNVGACGP